jgi:ABC-type polysaccharide/polyol phosphate export permease
LGFVWSILKPLALIGIYTVVFSSFIDSGKGWNGKPLNYGLYVFAGILPWLSIQESLQRGSTVFVDLSHLVKHHALPLSLLPLHIVLSTVISQLIAIVVCLIFKWTLTGGITYHVIFILAFVPFQILFCFGITLALATLNVFLRDISHLTTTLLFVWFFTSPIVYPIERLSGLLRDLLWLNPLTSLTVIYRDLLLFGRFPTAFAVTYFVFSSVLMLLCGYAFYRRTHRVIVDWI